jgi:hypothetical protein
MFKNILYCALCAIFLSFSAQSIPSNALVAKEKCVKDSFREVDRRIFINPNRSKTIQAVLNLMNLHSVSGMNPKWQSDFLEIYKSLQIVANNYIQEKCVKGISDYDNESAQGILDVTKAYGQYLDVISAQVLREQHIISQCRIDGLIAFTSRFEKGDSRLKQLVSRLKEPKNTNDVNIYIKLYQEMNRSFFVYCAVFYEEYNSTDKLKLSVESYRNETEKAFELFILDMLKKYNI